MTPWTGEADHLSDRIAAFVEGSLTRHATESFDELALAIHRWQRGCDPVVAALTEREPTTWAEIPAVPVGLFKDLPVGTVRADEPHVVFRTSGTTGGGRGEHRLRSTALYDLGALGWAREVLGDAPGEVAAFLDDPARAPDSSLSHMVASFPAFSDPPGRATWHVRDGVLDRADLEARVRAAGRPLFVASTAFALAEWLEDPPPALPTGSVLMVTGGFKGREHRLDGAALYREARNRLQPARIVTEYGMTELSSQLWGTPTTPYRPPPWLRAVAADPHTGSVLAPGSRGQLRFYDLCNLDGTVGIETMDEGIVGEDGSVTLLGRLPGAPERGCSLTVEEAWAKTGSAGSGWATKDAK